MAVEHIEGNMMDSRNSRISSGVQGLDEILQGGLLPGRAYLVTGSPGTGKTVFGFQFLLAAQTHPLFVSFIETEQHLREDARSLDMPTDRIDFLDLTADTDVFSEVQTYDIFSPSEIEREPIAHSIRNRIEQLSPDRIFIDGFSQLRSISADIFQFHRMVQSLFRYAMSRNSTILVTGTDMDTDADTVIQSAVDGVIRLTREGHLRSVEIMKMRGSAFLPYRHPLRITSAGLEIFPEAA